MFLSDAKIQVSKILTDFFFGAKNGPKIKCFRKKSPNVAFFKKGGWFVGWVGLMGYFSACMHGVRGNFFPDPLLPLPNHRCFVWNF